jgi:aspartyl aminopeptidase
MATAKRGSGKRKGGKKAAKKDAAKARTRARAEDLLTFLDESPGAYHAVAALTARFEKAGFATLEEGEPFAIEAGGRYLIERRGTALLAIHAGRRPPSEAGFQLIAAHTDSPGFKLKPNPETVEDGLVRLGVEVYGSPILVTWTDRDLGLCGRVIVETRGKLETRLVRTGPIVCLPNLAIHLNRTANEEGLKINPQTELAVILGAVEEGLPEEGALRWLLSRELKVKAERILDFDLFLYDTAPASFAGAHEEFVRSGRLDDLAMCHAASIALTEAEDEADATRLVVAYDAEEIGSLTSRGARSNLLPSVLERLCLAMGDDRDGYLRALARSRLVSADNAHARHPGYAGQSEPSHAPRLNGGPVIKTQATYATDGHSAAFFEQACRAAGVTSQRFVSRSDMRTGGTVGTMVASQLGIPAVDVGSAQLAMHSVREMAGVRDHDRMTEALAAFFRS